MKPRAVLGELRPRPDEPYGDPRVCVALLDGPVDLSHPCFAGADLTRLTTLVQEPAGPGPMSLHGTHVASLLFGMPGTPLTGLAPHCRGLILPVFRDGGDGRVPQMDLARAIERAVEEGAHVINISGGERADTGQADALLERALRLCEDQGVLVVSAAGNDGADTLQVPAAVPSVLAVGAAAADGSPLDISNWGGAYRTHGILAPGQNIEGAAPGGGLASLTGSSFATPSWPVRRPCSSRPSWPAAARRTRRPRGTPCSRRPPLPRTAPTRTPLPAVADSAAAWTPPGRTPSSPPGKRRQP